MLDYISQNFLAGILSTIGGVIIYLVKLFLNKYFYKNDLIEQANKEVVENVAHYASEGKLPAIIIFESLINFVARKNKIKRNTMYSIDEYLDELVGKVFQEKLIRAEEKEHFLLKLEKYKTTLISNSNVIEKTDEIINYRVERNKFKNYLDYILIVYLLFVFIYISYIFIKVLLNNLSLVAIEDIINSLSFLVILFLVCLLIKLLILIIKLIVNKIKNNKTN